MKAFVTSGSVRDTTVIEQKAQNVSVVQLQMEQKH